VLCGGRLPSLERTKHAAMVPVGQPVSAGADDGPKKTIIKKKKIVNKYITNNTINNYFAAAPPPPPPQAQAGPSSEAAPLPGDLLPPEERAKYVRVPAKKRNVLVSRVARKTGKLLGGCKNCAKNFKVDIARFAPADSNATAKKRADFFAANAAFDAAVAAGDLEEAKKQRAIVEELRTDRCDDCNAVQQKLSPAPQACKDLYNERRKAACLQNDGCANPDCPERGPSAECVLTADHGTNEKTRDKNSGEPISPGSYVAWSCNGGVEALRVELDTKIEQWICHCCHALESTSASGNRNGDPDEMPKGKWNGTEEEVKQYKARRHATVRFPKQQYVDARKLEIGACAACKRPVIEGQNEQAFEFNHLDPPNKNKGGLYGEHGGVAGLVNNCCKSEATLDKVQPLLDEEMHPSVCNLLCSNCHHRHTKKLPPREPVD
jgi:hypothetical protein